MFVQTCYSMITEQKKVFTWIDSDELMDQNNKDTCLYYDIHSKRSRVFLTPMVADWLAINLYYPMCRTIMTDEAYIKERGTWKIKMQLRVAEALKDTHTKHGALLQKDEPLLELQHIEAGTNI